MKHAVLTFSLAIPLVLFSYSNSFTVPFQFDDYTYIVKNPVIKSLESLSAIWRINPQRVVVFLSFALNYTFGGLNVSGYHLVNLLIHILTGLVVYGLAKQIFILTYPDSEKITNEGTARIIQAELQAALVAFIFLCHPIQTQAVTYIWQRTESLAALFYLSSLFLYILANRLSNTNSQLYLTASVITAVLAVFTKQTAASLPAAIFLIEYSFFYNSRSGRYQRLIPFVFIAMIIPLSMVFLGDRQLDDLQAAGKNGHTAKEYLFTQFRVILTYLRLLIWPSAQNIDYDYPVSTGFFEYRTFIPFCVHVIFFMLSVICWKRLRVVAVGMFLFMIMLSVESSIVPLEDIIFEHRLYLPSVAFFIVVIGGFGRFLVEWKYYNIIFVERNKILITLLCAFLILPYARATYLRNEVWKSEASLWMDTLSKSPKKSRPLATMAAIKKNQGEYEVAIKLYKQAIKADTENWQGYNNLGMIYGNKGDLEKAHKFFNKAIIIAKKAPEPLINLATYYQKKGEWQMARKSLRKAMKIAPNYSPIYICLANLYRSQGNNAIAVNILLALIKRYQLNYRAHGLVGEIYLEQGELDQALNHFILAEKFSHDSPKVYDRLGIAYGMNRQHAKAVKAFERALAINPSYLPAYLNYGAYLERHNRAKKAFSLYQEARKQNPRSAEILLRIGSFFLNQKKINDAFPYLHLALSECEAKYSCGIVGKIHNELGRASLEKKIGENH